MYRNGYRQSFQFLLTLIAALAFTVTPAWAQSKEKPLSEKDDPALIGKRNINKGQMNFYSLDREVAVGRQLAMEIDSQSQIITDPIINEFVNRIAQNIVLHSDAKVPFTVKVLDDQVINAFALPGGFLYVNRGVLEAAENEAEVAGVMAHEIAHVTARHGMEQQSKAEFFNYASIPLIFLGGLGGYAIQQAVGIAVPLGFLKFSRGSEKEADRLGAQYMWAAGYDPTALVTFFEKLNAREKRKAGTLEKIFSTHPMTGDRITEAQKLIARFPDKNEYSLNSSEYQQIKARLGATSTARRVGPPDDKDDKRPVLRRRPDNGDPTATNDDDDRPVLKRRDDNGTTTTTTTDAPASTSTPTSSKDEERVELKRSKPAPTNSDSDRPTLKRREGSESETTKPAETKPASETKREKP
ncbi:MAG: M48 family metalloprotease [Acidobacteria bacterium]|nr:M48 family metalloprotease [Acidobacteriota bacterium]